MKYMILNITTVEGTCVVAVRENATEAGLLGRIKKAEGYEMIAPPLEGRGFSKLDKLQLQYLFWNTTKQTPPEDYAELIKVLAAAIDLIPVDTTPVRELERLVEQLDPTYSSPSTEPAEPKEPKAPKDPNARPKATSTTGWVWEICDKLFVENGNQIPDRKKAIDACVAEDINAATASTQYAKWKKAKESALVPA